MDSTIIAAIIGFLGMIIAAFIGKARFSHIDALLFCFCAARPVRRPPRRRRQAIFCASHRCMRHSRRSYPSGQYKKSPPLRRRSGSAAHGMPPGPEAEGRGRGEDWFSAWESSFHKTRQALFFCMILPEPAGILCRIFCFPDILMRGDVYDRREKRICTNGESPPEPGKKALREI